MIAKGVVRMWAIILSLPIAGGAIAAFAFFFSAEGNPRIGKIVSKTMACSKLDDLKHARFLGETNLMAALTYALTHNCALLDEDMRVIGPTFRKHASGRRLETSRFNNRDPRRVSSSRRTTSCHLARLEGERPALNEVELPTMKTPTRSS